MAARLFSLGSIPQDQAGVLQIEPPEEGNGTAVFVLAGARQYHAALQGIGGGGVQTAEGGPVLL